MPVNRFKLTSWQLRVLQVCEFTVGESNKLREGWTWNEPASTGNMLPAVFLCILVMWQLTQASPSSELADGRAPVSGLSQNCTFRRVLRSKLREKLHLRIGGAFDWARQKVDVHFVAFECEIEKILVLDSQVQKHLLSSESGLNRKDDLAEMMWISKYTYPHK